MPSSASGVPRPIGKASRLRIGESGAAIRLVDAGFPRRRRREKPAAAPWCQSPAAKGLRGPDAAGAIRAPEGGIRLA